MHGWIVPSAKWCCRQAVEHIIRLFCFVQQCGTNNVVPHATTNNARAFVRDVLFFVTTV